MRLTCIPRWARARCCRALALLGGMAALTGAGARLSAQSAEAAADTLRQPPVAPNFSRRPGVVEVEITAAPARIPLLGLAGIGPVITLTVDGSAAART